MADDLHDVARYLNDMRICFIALTVTGYIVLILYAIIFCVRRSRRRPGVVNNNSSRSRSRWDYQVCTYLLICSATHSPTVVASNGMIEEVTVTTDTAMNLTTTCYCFVQLFQIITVYYKIKLCLRLSLALLF